MKRPPDELRLGLEHQELHAQLNNLWGAVPWIADPPLTDVEVAWSCLDSWFAGVQSAGRTAPRELLASLDHAIGPLSDSAQAKQLRSLMSEIRHALEAASAS